jgi:hypothetical protein
MSQSLIRVVGLASGADTSGMAGAAGSSEGTGWISAGAGVTSGCADSASEGVAGVSEGTGSSSVSADVSLTISVAVTPPTFTV